MSALLTGLDPRLLLVVGVLRAGGALDPRALAELEPNSFVELLRRHGVASLFRAVVRERFGDVLPPALDTLLAAELRLAVARSLVQERALRIAAGALDSAGVPWVLWRGLHLGRLLYTDVSLRIGVDVDLLVAPADRDDALRALTGAGFGARARATTASHEIALLGEDTWFDLHWEVLRPGRSAIDIGEFVRTRVVRSFEVSVPDATATLVVLLLHTAITEHVTARLIRAVDLDRLLRTQSLDWDVALATLIKSGLRAAAWAMLTWTRALLETPVDDAVLSALSPGRAREEYLRAWLRRDPGSAYRRAPTVVRAGFSLAMQEGPVSLARASLGLLAARYRGARLARRRP